MEDENDNSNSDEQMIIFEAKNERKSNKHLSKTAQKQIAQSVENSKISCQINDKLDPFNKAQRANMTVQISHRITFRHYFIKNKFRDEKVKVFDEMINLLNERGYNDISTINDREEEQIMVIRVIYKVEGSFNTFIIEDQTGKDKLTVIQGILWVGMICAIKAKWIDGGYKLEKIIDLVMPINSNSSRFNAPMKVNRLMLVKGPFRPKFNDEDHGIEMITKELQKLRRKNIMVNQIVVMGPILSKSNRFVQNCMLKNTFQEEYETTLRNFRMEVNRISEQIQIFVQVALEDVISIYPIPQPNYEPEDRKIKIKYLSNPSSIKLEGRVSSCKIDLINYDILKYIDTHKLGKPTKQLLQQNLETYLKQPFYLTNTTTAQDPFDEINLPNLYNHGNFGDLVVFSSIRSPPFAKEVNGRIMLNIGSLGIEPNESLKSFIVIASLYEGDSPAARRMKIETISSE